MNCLLGNKWYKLSGFKDQKEEKKVKYAWNFSK